MPKVTFYTVFKHEAVQIAPAFDCVIIVNGKCSVLTDWKVVDIFLTLYGEGMWLHVTAVLVKHVHTGCGVKHR
jgi:hypothetical protein